VYFLGVKAAGG